MKKEICKNCTHYSAFYKQNTCGFERLTYGICSVSEEQSKGSETCEKFNNNELKEKRQKETLYLFLNHALKSLNNMIFMIQEKENLLDNQDE